MLFNSYEFIFLFLPITLFVFFRIGAGGRAQWAIAWLVLASLFFYGWWNPIYLSLILASAVFNYSVGFALGSRLPPNGSPNAARRALLTLGVCTNLAVLAYFKYAAFLLSTWFVLIGEHGKTLPSIILPLAISFFTFQQIAYLVDAYRGEAREYSFLHYLLFVTYFPQLIAGPIVHHQEMLPQFAKSTIYRFSHSSFAIGASIFAMGLFKKVILADNIAPYANEVFHAAQQGDAPTFFLAWGGSLAYTFQLYFDFSGYSDMAIGLARMVGLKLPINFNSPYKSVNIVDFWRRWHITLSRFLRDYLYIPLGGNRKGKARRYANLLLTMLLGGLWHGAGWTFVVWGGLHGAYLVVNHIWHALKPRLTRLPGAGTTWGKVSAMFITFVAVVVGWVFFRAESFGAASRILAGMVGLNGVSIPSAVARALGPARNIVEGWGWEVTLGGGRKFAEMYIGVLVLATIAFWAPNTQQILRRYSPALCRRSELFESLRRGSLAARIEWRPSLTWAALVASISLASILGLNRVSEFLYFQF